MTSCHFLKECQAGSKGEGFLMHPSFYQEEIIFQKPHSKYPHPIGSNRAPFLLLKQSLAKAHGIPQVGLCLCDGRGPAACSVWYRTQTHLGSANSQAFDQGNHRGLSRTSKAIDSCLTVCGSGIGKWCSLSEPQRMNSSRSRNSISFLLLSYPLSPFWHYFQFQTVHIKQITIVHFG